MIGEEIAHADGTQFSGLICLLQVAVGTIAVAIRLMKQHEVDVVGLQFTQTLIDALHGLAFAVV